MHAVDVPERRHAQAGQVGALPQPVAVDEFRAPGILDGGVGAADRVAGLLERGERLVHPAPLGGPGRHGLIKLAGAVQAVAADRSVERQLHLVDGDAVRIELDRPPHRVPPLLFGLAQHAGDQIDVDLREINRPREVVGPEDLGRAVCASVQLQDVVVEVLDAETEPRDAHVANRGELGLGERARLALERDLASGRPRRCGRQPVDQPPELPDREERRRAAAEIDEVERPPGDGRLPGVQLPLPPQHIEVRLDLRRVLVRVNPEVAEMAALAAERDVEVQAERDVRRRRGKGRVGSLVHRLRRPDRKRRIVGDEVAADLRFGRRSGCRGYIAHRSYYTSPPSGGGVAHPACLQAAPCRDFCVHDPSLRGPRVRLDGTRFAWTSG